MADIYELELPAEVIEVAVNRDQSDLTLNRWDGECSMRITLPTRVRPSVVTESGRITLQDERVDFRVIPLRPDDERDYGGLEIEVVLKERPIINQVTLALELDNLVAHYQPRLTREEIARGDDRPDNVVGSYAVYHATKGCMHLGRVNAEKYRCGKAFHVYRPQAIDQRGDRVWCDLSIGRGLMMVTIPRGWLDTASYPVIIDPDFGYHGAGGTGASIENVIRAGEYVCPEDNVVGVRIVPLMKHTGTPLRCKCALYSGNNLIANSNTEEKSGFYVEKTWTSFDFLTPPDLSNQAYRISAWGEEGANVNSVFYDTVGGITHYYRDRTYETGTGWPNPLSPGFLTQANLKLCIYCEYDYPPGGGGHSPAAELVQRAMI